MNETSVHLQSEWIKTDKSKSGNGAGRSPAGASSSSVSARRIAASDRRLTAPPETNRVEDVPADSLPDVSSGATSIADVDGDGNKDLLIAGDPHEGHIRIGGDEPEPITTLYLGDGAGNFSEANADLLNISNGSTSFADFNGDGNPDLLIAGKDPSDTPAAALYLGDGNGGFSKAEVDLTRVRDLAVSTADVNGDENEDLLIVGATRPMSNPVIKLYRGHGDGTFSAGSLDLTGVYNATASIADVNRDGDQDLFVTGSNSSHEPTTSLYLGNGDGTFTPVEDR